MENLIQRKRPAEPLGITTNTISSQPSVPAVSVDRPSLKSESSITIGSKAKNEEVHQTEMPKKPVKPKRVRKLSRKRDDLEYYNSNCSSKKSTQSSEEPVRTQESKGARKSRRRHKFKSNMEDVTGITGEEEKMLAIAIKNSLREKKAKTDIELNEIKEMQTYHPTESEFKDPIAYIEKLYKEGANEYGCIKIIPPESYRPPIPIDEESTKKLPSRFQTLQNLSLARPFDVNKEGVTCSELKNRAPSDSYYKQLLDQCDYDQIEKEFWKCVDNNQGDPIQVEYAADLPTTEYGLNGGHSEEHLKYAQHEWNLNKMHTMKNSLLQFCKDKPISGITMSWLYVGMMFSSFCWHYEDIMMYSINYMHTGHGKIWYAIPDYHREKFERLAKQKLAMLFNEDPNLLHNINVMINPAWLVENGVHVYRTLQKPGEFVLTFPESYHQGLSVGYNVAEAVNMTYPSWLDHGDKAMSIYMSTREKVPVFPLDWLLIENVRHIFDLEYDLEHLRTLSEHYKKWLQKELTERSLIASNFSDKKRYFHETLKMLEHRDEVEEDQHECFYCINLCYASFVKCLSCNKHYCIGHELICGCRKDKIRVILRYSNDELNQFLTNIEEKLKTFEL